MRDLSGIQPALVQDTDAAMLQAALRYALNDGWRVFPLEPGGKRPFAALAPHGVLDATTDVDTIKRWWEQAPTANVGIATGGGLVVLDIDGPDGETALRELERIDGRVTDTLEARTGKGRHLYLACDGVDIRNSAGRVGKHLDVRGEGGYVVAPPSLHESGARYAFRDASKSAARLPVKWAERIAAPPPPAPGDAPPEMPDRIPQGGRNDAFTRLAGYLQRKGLDPAAIEAALMVENAKRCHPQMTAAEVSRIVSSVGRYTPADPYVAQTVPASPLASRLTRLDLAELLSVEPDPPAWVWNGYLEEGTVGMIHSDGGLGKSLLTMGLAAAITSGGAYFMGRPTCAGNVLILDGENPAREIHRRLTAFGFTSAEERLGYIRVEEPVLGYPGSTEELLGPLIEAHKARLIIFDSLRALWAGDENETTEVRPMFTALRRVAEELGCAFLVVHHDNKGGGYSGSTDLHNSLDSRLHLHRPAPSGKEREIRPEDRRRILTHAKMRGGGPELPRLDFQVVMSDGRFDLELDEAAPRHEPKPDDRLERIGQLVRANLSMTPGELARAVDISVRTLQRMTAPTLATVGVYHDLDGRRFVHDDSAHCHLCGMDALTGNPLITNPPTCRACRQEAPS